MKYYWYKAKRRPPADKVVNGFYGFEKQQEYMECQLYDLRFIAYETFDELCDRYF